MCATAVICELNPIHNGHLHVINKAKEAAPTPVILVMSGNFTQRAGAAAFHKYKRAEAAVKSGADLVVELPFPYSCAGAEIFSDAGVRIANALGACRLVFGSECGDLDKLETVARVLDSDEYKRLFSALSEKDPSAGAAVIRSRALKALVPDHSTDPSPNDTLAVEYIRSVDRLSRVASSRVMECIPVKRISTPSASDIRKMRTEDCTPFVPPECAEMMYSTPRADEQILFDLLWKLFRLCDTDLSSVAECGGGLGERLRNTARRCVSAQEFFVECRTKRYTNSRITRAAIFAFAGVSAEELLVPPAYTTLLAASPGGTALLSRLRKAPTIPILTKPADFADLPESAKRQLHLGMKMDELYTLLIGEHAGFFMKRSPYIKQK